MIVIGLGVMGAASCRALARRGMRVLGLEQFELCHARGSSHGRSRVIRKAYFEDPRYVPLLHSAYRLWQELEAETQETILHRTGCLNLGPPDHECVRGARRSAEEHRLPHEVMTAAEVRARWPVLAPAADDIGIYERDAGFVVPERCVRLLADQARLRGAELREREPVRRWSCAGGEVEVVTDAAHYRGAQLVLSAGPWLGPLVGADLPLRVERQVQLWFAPPRPERFRAGRLPVVIHFLADRAYYAVPGLAGDPLKVARHHGGELSEPDQLRRHVTDSDEAEVRWYLRQHLPDADVAPAASEVCLYTNTPDDHFVIDRHPTREKVVIAGGFCGHGFKFAPLVGEVVADLLTQRRTDHPIGLFSIGRFAS